MKGKNVYKMKNTKLPECKNENRTKREKMGRKGLGLAILFMWCDDGQ